MLMRKSSGISMISLIVTIIVTILLAGTAITLGTKYIKESKDKEKEVFVSVLSSAVAQRQEAINVNSFQYPYLGYYINDDSIFERIFASKIKDNISYDDGTWYVVDATTAGELGVKEAKTYINSIQTSSEDKVSVALVNYVSGTVYLVDISSSELANLELFSENVAEGHTHRYDRAEPTCTLPVKCLECGFIYKEALGHSYNDSTPTAVPGDEENSHSSKVCSRCGMTGGYEPHKFKASYIENSSPWLHEFKCEVCDYTKSESELCEIEYSLPTNTSEKETRHVMTCKVCGKTDTELHTIGYRRTSETTHEKYCTVEGCSYVIATEPHVNNGYDVCEDCGSTIINYEYPTLRIVNIINKNAESPDERYIAKYGDEVQLTITADKPIRNLNVSIGNQAVPAGNMTTSDNKTWNITLTLDKAMNLPDGNIAFSIMCESSSGIQMPEAVTRSTDGKNVVFDGTLPTISYIDKDTRASE